MTMVQTKLIYQSSIPKEEPKQLLVWASADDAMGYNAPGYNYSISESSAIIEMNTFYFFIIVLSKLQNN